MVHSSHPRRKPNWTVIGGGNGGQALAGHLALMGFPVKLYDIVPETIDIIRGQQGIQVDGAVNGFGRIEFATTDLAEAVGAADIVMVVAPAVAHRIIAKNCAPLLENGQVVFIHPGATGGALEFKRTLDEENCDKQVTVSEANSLLYACRSPQPGRVSILGIKKELMVAALPGSETSRVVSLLTTAFPQMAAGANVMETSLSNPNAMMHPGPTLLNTAMIESGREWLYYWDGITPSIGAFVEAMDIERVALGRALDLDLPSIREWYRLAYGAVGATLSEAVKENHAYAGVKGQHSLRTRYLLEDVPMGLVPMVSLGKLLGVPVERMETVVRLAEFLLDEDLVNRGRTVENLGLASMSAEGIRRYLETGQRAPGAPPAGRHV